MSCDCCVKWQKKQKQTLADPELLVNDNEVPSDVSPREGEIVNAESKSEYCTIALLTIICLRCINTPEQ